MASIEYRPEVGAVSAEEKIAIEGVAVSYGSNPLIVGRDLNGELYIELGKREKPRKSVPARR